MHEANDVIGTVTVYVIFLVRRRGNVRSAIEIACAKQVDTDCGAAGQDDVECR